MDPSKLLIKKIKYWLRLPGNSQAKLCAHLGYKSSATINYWYNTGRIPEYVHQKIEDFLKIDDEGKRYG